MEEMYENLDGLQHSSPFTSADTIHEEGKLPSQPHQNSTTIYEVEVQDRDLPNMLEEKSMIALENDDQPTNPLPLRCMRNYMLKILRWIRKGARVTLMELEKGLTTLKDEEPKEMHIIEIPIEKKCDRAI